MANEYDPEQIEKELVARRNARLNKKEPLRQILAIEQIADELYHIRKLLIERNARLR